VFVYGSNRNHDSIVIFSAFVGVVQPPSCAAASE
jgi:hypothetical protein